MRHRNIFFALGTGLVLAVMLATDPDDGLLTGFWALEIAKGVVAVAFAHFARKALMDYPEADARALFEQARHTPTGAGLALVAQALVIVGLLFLFGGNARAAVPVPALDHMPTLSAELAKHWPDNPAPHMLAAQVHKETCITERHRFCWSPKARLKTKREEGAGLGQITRAYRADGVTRFDALAEMRNRHPTELWALSWANVYDAPALQLRALVLKAKDDARALRGVADVHERTVMQVAAYNRGIGGVQSERRVCKAKAGCDPSKWAGHVEHTCTASREPIYGGRSACDINRAYVRTVVGLAARYEGLV